MKLSSMRARMTLGLTLFVALLTFLGGLGLWLRNYTQAQNQSLALLETTTERVREATKRGETWETIASTVSDQNLATPVGEVELWRVGPDRRDRGHLRSLSEPRFPPHPPRPGDAGASSRNFIPPLDDPSGWYFQRVPLGAKTLIVGVPWHQQRRALDAQAVALLLLGLFTSGVSGLGAWVLVGRTLSPIEWLAAQARGRAQEGRNAGAIVLQAPSPDREVIELVSTFNALLDSVAQGAKQRERFHAAASHELRTPLQALSGTLQLALARPRSNEEYHEALRVALTQSGRLNALTRDLLTLNQLELATTKPPLESVDVAEACDLSLSSLQDTIAQKSLHLQESLQPLEVIAPPSHVEMLCRNLLENAAKYAPSRGRIQVETGHDSNGLQLRVWNQTAQPVQGDLSAWCEPFYRPDEARTSAIGGNGLGLAICRAVCDANGWSLHLEPTNTPSRTGVSVIVNFAPPPSKNVSSLPQSTTHLS